MRRMTQEGRRPYRTFVCQYQRGPILCVSVPEQSPGVPAAVHVALVQESPLPRRVAQLLEHLELQDRRQEVLYVFLCKYSNGALYSIPCFL